MTRESMASPAKNAVMTHATGTIIDNAAVQAHGAVDFAASAAETALERARPVVDRAADAAHSAVESAAEAAENLHATRQKLVGNASGYIASNPVKSLAFALLAGAILGRIML